MEREKGMGDKDVMEGGEGSGGVEERETRGKKDKQRERRRKENGI